MNKPGKFTKEEYEIMKEHTVIGEKMLKNLELYQDEPLVKTACEIVRWHHERYDGKGYPDGLKGDKIPISAQIVSIADVYDELVSERVYKKAFSHEKAMEMILNGECGAFNPLLLECLVEIQDRIKTELDGSGSVKKETYKNYSGNRTRYEHKYTVKQRRKQMTLKEFYEQIDSDYKDVIKRLCDEDMIKSLFLSFLKIHPLMT